MKRATVMKWVIAIGGAVLSLALFVKRSRDKVRVQTLDKTIGTSFPQAERAKSSGATQPA